jgi:glycosyltransferase involved in cell wall biosynthesis
MQETKISVIIPVGNDAIYLGEVLNGLSEQTQKPFEVVIVDDRVTDSSLKLLQKTELPIKLLKTTEERYGVSSARNIGAESAGGDIIVFIDSDVLIPLDALSRIGKATEKYDGAIGIQSKYCGFNNTASKYKNQWMRWTFLKLKSPVSLFYTSLAGIKRSAFIESGGFDERYKMPSIEDTVFGNKLAQLGFKIHIDKQLEYIHKRRYSLFDILKTDFRRSKDLVFYFLKGTDKRRKPKTSVPLEAFLVLPISIIGLLYILISILVQIKVIAILGLSLILFIPILYIDFIKHILYEDGFKTAILSALIIIPDMIFSSFGVISSIINSLMKIRTINHNYI